MNDSQILPNDPNLTAYALGELEGDERVRLEARLQHDPAAQAMVDDIRHLAAKLEGALENETAELPKKAVAVSRTRRSPAGKLLQFPQVYYVIGGLAAASFAVLVALRTPRPLAPPPGRQFVHIPLPASPQGEIEPVPVLPANSSGADDTSSTALPAAALMPPTFDAKVPLTADLGKAATALPGEPINLALTQPLPPVFGPESAETLGRESARRERQAEAKSSAVRTRYYAGGAASARPKSGLLAARGDNLLAVNAEPIVLSPFDVQAPAESGYAAQSTLAGTRFGQRSNTEAYAYRPESDFLVARDYPLSTFSADVDTASYANVRRFIQSGQLPPADAVRIEELLNYFPYAYTGPKSGDRDAPPFTVTMEAADAPWTEGHRLVRIGIKARDVAAMERAPANLVFLLDVSGSMNQPNKLPLVKESMRLLLARLRPDDRVAIVTYAGASGLALPSTVAAKRAEIAAAIDELNAGGSTNGARGIELAYDIAKANFISAGINRVILCTDGDFNVGVTSEGELTRLIEEKAKSGVFLTVLGFGMGNLKDSTMQQLADRGNGSYGYIDTRREAEKMLVEQVSGTLVTVAKDVKLQVEFNPLKVARYRLIGYEKRALRTEDFANDKVDAGEVGAGHTVTALYEIVPVSATEAGPAAAPEQELRYMAFASAPTSVRAASAEVANELLTLKLRYKEPAGLLSKKLEYPLLDRSTRFADASADFKFAAAVAEFGMLLRGSAHKGAGSYAAVAQWAEAGAAHDPGGYRAEFIGLVKQAETLAQ